MKLKKCFIPILIFLCLSYFIGTKLFWKEKREFYFESGKGHFELLKSANEIQWDICKSKFNDEFKFAFDSDLPVPMSIFHRNSTLKMILSTQTYIAYSDFPEWQRNFTSTTITDAKKWYRKNTWKIQYQSSDGNSQLDSCEAIQTPANMIMVVVCPLSHPNNL